MIYKITGGRVDGTACRRHFAQKWQVNLVKITENIKTN